MVCDNVSQETRAMTHLSTAEEINLLTFLSRGSINSRCREFPTATANQLECWLSTKASRSLSASRIYCIVTLYHWHQKDAILCLCVFFWACIFNSYKYTCSVVIYMWKIFKTIYQKGFYHTAFYTYFLELNKGLTIFKWQTWMGTGCVLCANVW